ncbi:hypothetical protein X738_30785 [Mesorhizobium sp. LNHC209A00]|nr:hypothetical protein X738_30785 [Mesorhizobium sp. LNHC209A00]
MSDDVDGVEPFVRCKRGCDLPRCRPVAIEHDSTDFGPQVAKNRVEIGDRRIDKENFRGTGHDWLLLA